jgi:hypothetical protein
MSEANGPWPYAAPLHADIKTDVHGYQHNDTCILLAVAWREHYPSARGHLTQSANNKQSVSCSLKCFGYKHEECHADACAQKAMSVCRWSKSTFKVIRDFFLATYTQRSNLDCLAGHRFGDVKQLIVWQHEPGTFIFEPRHTIAPRVQILKKLTKKYKLKEDGRPIFGKEKTSNLENPKLRCAKRAVMTSIQRKRALRIVCGRFVTIKQNSFKPK